MYNPNNSNDNFTNYYNQDTSSYNNYSQPNPYYDEQQNVKSKPNNTSTFIILGLVIVITFVAMIPVISFTFNGKELTAKMDDMLPYLLSGIFVVVGLVLTVIGILKMIGTKKRCTHRVYATCVDIDSYDSYDSESGSYTTVYSPIYEIYHYGQMHRIKNTVYSSSCKIHPGEQVELLINPDKPEEFLDARGRGGVHGTLMLIGIIFLFVGIMFGVIFFNVK